MKTAKYEIRWIKFLTYPDGQVAGGDDEWEADAATKASAFAKAKKASLRQEVYEAMVYEFANGRDADFTGQWYFENGKMTWDMGGNN